MRINADDECHAERDDDHPAGQPGAALLKRDHRCNRNQIDYDQVHQCDRGRIGLDFHKEDQMPDHDAKM